MSWKLIPNDFLEDIIKVFLLGVPSELINTEVSEHFDIIARPYGDFEYIVEWKDLFHLRRNIIKSLKNSHNDKLITLANAIEDIHSGN